MYVTPSASTLADDEVAARLRRMVTGGRDVLGRDGLLSSTPLRGVGERPMRLAPLAGMIRRVAEEDAVRELGGV